MKKITSKIFLIFIAVIAFSLTDGFISDPGADIYANPIKAFKSSYGNTKLHSAVLNGEAEKVKRLLKDRTLIDRKNYEGKTPLYMAADKGRYSIAKILIAAGADVNTSDNDDFTLLHLLSCDVSVQSAEIADMLIKRGAKANVKESTGATPMNYAALYGNIRVLVILIKNGADVNSKNDVGITPLVTAVTHFDLDNSPDVIKKLIDEKADVNVGSDMVGSVMHYVSILDGRIPNDLEKIEWILKTLVKAGADINIKNILGNTPLYKAVENNNINIAKLFLESGALPHIKNNNGQSAYGLACENQQMEIIALIEANASIKTKKIGGIEFVYIPSGNFLMGASGFGRNKDELPPHRVKIREFYMSRYEITQNQYEKYTGKNPALTQEKYDKSIVIGTDDFPVENVSWDDAVLFCKIFGEKNSVRARLPYEAEWEYAFRAGSDSKYHWGDKYRYGYCYNKVMSESERQSPGTIGFGMPNDWGLFDMCGNVSEWCMDWYDMKYYSVSTADNPRGPASGNERVLRGGFFGSSESDMKSAGRSHECPSRKSNVIGFRIIVEK